MLEQLLLSQHHHHHHHPQAVYNQLRKIWTILIFRVQAPPPAVDPRPAGLSSSSSGRNSSSSFFKQSVFLLKNRFSKRIWNFRFHLQTSQLSLGLWGPEGPEGPGGGPDPDQTWTDSPLVPPPPPQTWSPAVLQSRTSCLWNLLDFQIKSSSSWVK